MTDTVQWCSLFCEGNEAIGELTVPIGEDDTAIPVCEECMEKVTTDPAKALAVITGIW